MAGRLDQIDIRAHSLQSSLVDAHLRDQWATLRHDFLQLDQKLSPTLALQADSPDEQFAKHAFSIGEAKDICERVEIAERPGIDSPVFFAGVGYHGLIPYSAMNSWNAAAIASQSSSSSSVNGGFSSGFSGAGGSSSF